MAYPRDPIPALKQRVANEILILTDGWTQANAAALIDGLQPRISELRAGRLNRYSLERLLRYLSSLGRGIEIVTTKARLGVLDHALVDKSNAPQYPRRAALELRAAIAAAAAELSASHDVHPDDSHDCL